MRSNSLLACFVVIWAWGCGATRDPEPPSVAELTAKLEKDDVNVQMEAISWIKQLGPKAAATRPALIAALKSQHALVRQSAAAALGQIGAEAAEAVPALSEALRDSELSVRRAAADALGKLGPAAVAATAALENMAKENDSCDTAQTALKKIRQ